MTIISAAAMMYFTESAYHVHVSFCTRTLQPTRIVCMRSKDPWGPNDKNLEGERLLVMRFRLPVHMVRCSERAVFAMNRRDFFCVFEVIAYVLSRTFGIHWLRMH